MRVVGALAVALFLSVGGAGAARATSLIPITVEEIAARSDVVIEGEVVAIESRLVGRRVITFATIRVDDVLRGVLGQPRVVTVAVLGGVAGSITQRVPGAPVFVLHTRYVAALSPPNGPDGARSIIGFSQGLWRVAPAGPPAAGGPTAEPVPRDRLRAAAPTVAAP